MLEVTWGSEDLFLLMAWLFILLWQGYNSNRNKKQLVTLHLQSGSREIRVGPQVIVSLGFSQNSSLRSGTTYIYDASSHFGQPNLEIPLQKYPEVCLVGDSMFCQVENINLPSSILELLPPL